MFASIRLLKKEVVDGGLRVTFKVKDTCFSQDVEVLAPIVDTSYVEPVAVIKAYSTFNLNVARNLAIYYLGVTQGATYLEQDLSFIGKNFPSLSYDKKFILVQRYYRELKTVVDLYEDKNVLKQAKIILKRFNLE